MRGDFRTESLWLTYLYVKNRHSTAPILRMRKLEPVPLLYPTVHVSLSLRSLSPPVIMSSEEPNNLVEKAKLAEQAERYEDMAKVSRGRGARVFPCGGAPPGFSPRTRVIGFAAVCRALSLWRYMRRSHHLCACVC